MARKIRLKLREILKQRNIEQKELAEKTGLSVRTISELCNNVTKRYPKEALERIADYLEIDDVSELFEIVHEQEKSDS
ncbi:helix-turn-helix transcriptional regulator [Geobacillus thermodenitrificans]|uniref:helix-turn-helix domain-containing protein n=1 Tax=Geobacillus thermodenitrificans TaxID=33940 RepID=UPI002E1BF9A8|nr:helix-turn-helix transcriptional regulator [Geobacillus thermodenitrificans]